ncbi:hypothetical protein [Streptomyces luteireticuli]|uniref:Uncharacterized protein n=1 Tax=Streptomyces luteireticuli TaxID=173858 RepID=A0ABN0YRV8_9ACTN
MTTTPKTGTHVHVYEHPEDFWTEVFEVIDKREEVIADDGETRDHPEVPLTPTQRDAVITRLGYQRTGPWTVADTPTEAPVKPIPENPFRAAL